MERKLPNPALIASLAPKNFDEARRLAAAVPPDANALEWRLDLSQSRISARALLELDPRCAILTTRTIRDGGKFEGLLDEYRSVLQSAYDLGAIVDVEIESGLLANPAFLPDRSRVLASRHAPDLMDAARVRRLCAAGVGAVKLVRNPCGSVAAAAECLALQRELAGLPVASFAMGERGAFTRVLSALAGGALVYGSSGEATAEGQMPLAELFGTYRVARGETVRSIFGIYGANVSESLSPRIHNTLFRLSAPSAVYVPIQATTGYADREAFTADIAALEAAGVALQGLSVTNPFKEVCFDPGNADLGVRDAGAANTLVREGGHFRAWNTDLVAMTEIIGRLDLAGRALVVAGTGGAARAALAAGRLAGCSLAVAGRNPDAVDELCGRFGAVPFALAAGSRVDAFVNATPLGRRSSDALPIPESILDLRPAVIDFLYRAEGETTLVRAARGRACRIADGLEILARQAVVQARLFGVEDVSLGEIEAILKGRDPRLEAA